MRNCEYIGNPAMFRSRVMGVGDQGSVQIPDWAAKGREAALESERMLKDAEKWRSNTPIVSFTSPNASGVARTINVYGYNKETGYVWLAEGPNSSAANSQLFPELVLASKFPEWVAWKSGSTSGLPLPLLLGAAYLLLA